MFIPLLSGSLLQVLDGELEAYFGTAPFETYPLFRCASQQSRFCYVDAVLITLSLERAQGEFESAREAGPTEGSWTHEGVLCGSVGCAAWDMCVRCFVSLQGIIRVVEREADPPFLNVQDMAAKRHPVKVPLLLTCASCSHAQVVLLLPVVA